MNSEFQEDLLSVELILRDLLCDLLLMCWDDRRR